MDSETRGAPVNAPGAAAAGDGAEAVPDLRALVTTHPSPSTLFAADPPRFTILAVSDSLAAAAGRSRESLVGRPLTEAFPGAADLPREASGIADLHAALDEAVRTGRPQRLRRRRHDVRRPDGTWESHWWDAVAVPVPDRAGMPCWVLHQAEDVTARVEVEQAVARAELALHESEALAAQQLARLEAIYRQVPVGLAVLDRELHFVRVNDRLAEMNGLPAAAHVGRTVGEVVPAIADAVAAIARQVIETGEPIRDLPLSGETKAMPGVPRHWVEQWYPLRDAAGTIIGINVVVDDVTERRHAEAALRESEARFRAVANLVPDLLWQSAPDGSASWHNDRWYAWTGQAPEEAAGRGWQDAIHPDEQPHVAASWARALAEGHPFAQELRLRGATGAYRWFLVRVAPQRDEAGRVVRWLGTATDVHAQRLAFEEVDRRVAERTRALMEAELARDALRRQLAGAEEAERRRLARELHDQLGQHLAALALGLAEVRRRQEAGEPAGERLAQLEALAGVMTRDARTLALELRPPELDDVGLESALATYLDQWGARYGIAAELAVTGDSATPLPMAAATALYRIAQEALTNVAKHAEATSVSVLLETGAREVRLVVEDDGAGFDVPAAMARARTERRLGFAGMRERAALVGGSLEVESTPGGGATLYVRVPLAGRQAPTPGGSAKD